MLIAITQLFAYAAALAAIIYAIAYAIPNYECYSKWRDSGLDSQYGLFAGCRVKTPDGRWLPAERVREIEITPKAAK